MDIFAWALIGGIVAWIAYVHLGYNRERGLMVSLALGAFGAVIGAKALAPIFLAAPTLDLSGALFAAAAAGAMVTLGELVHARWGV